MERFRRLLPDAAADLTAADLASAVPGPAPPDRHHGVRRQDESLRLVRCDGFGLFARKPQRVRSRKLARRDALIDIRRGDCIRDDADTRQQVEPSSRVT